MVRRRTILTAREIDYVAAVAEGLMDEQVAARLGVSSGRVARQIRNICWRLNLDDRLGLLAWWATQELDCAS